MKGLKKGCRMGVEENVRVLLINDVTILSTVLSKDKAFVSRHNKIFCILYVF